jgi:phosphoribosyl-AMP cyclohydrolase
MRSVDDSRDLPAPLRPAAHAADGRPLVTAIAQDADSREVLMLAWMDADALAATIATRRATYYSRSRAELWVKGETSGNTQEVLDVRVDCDGDAVLLLVRPAGPACHTGLRSCFDTGSLIPAPGGPS